MELKREHIGIFGKMNAGKSTLMNLLCQQDASIVDSTPGTTADSKRILIELHGLGPVKLYDTPGLDEEGILGEKKRKKAYNDLKEIDLALLVIDPRTTDFSTENDFIIELRKLGKQLIVVYNLFENVSEQNLEFCKQHLCYHNYYANIALNLEKMDNRPHLIEFLLSTYQPSKEKVELLPFAQPDNFYVLIVPMDEETPQGRLLRPQQLAVEYLIRHYSYPVCYRMDLTKARSEDAKQQNAEKKRYLEFLNSLKNPPKTIITDSQAMDIIPFWTPQHLQLTTFSITMVNYISMGKLKAFINGLTTLNSLNKKSKILIVEACNHSRICEDIGTVQIPRYLKQLQPDLDIDFNFGSEFLENGHLESYDLVIHCGACMISPQTLTARLRELENLGVAYTNYGLFLSYLQGRDVLKRSLQPWGLSEDVPKSL